MRVEIACRRGRGDDEEDRCSREHEPKDARAPGRRRERVRVGGVDALGTRRGCLLRAPRPHLAPPALPRSSTTTTGSEDRTRAASPVVSSIGGAPSDHASTRAAFGRGRGRPTPTVSSSSATSSRARRWSDAPSTRMDCSRSTRACSSGDSTGSGAQLGLRLGQRNRRSPRATPRIRARWRRVRRAPLRGREARLRMPGADGTKPRGARADPHATVPRRRDPRRSRSSSASRPASAATPCGSSSGRWSEHPERRT